MPSLHQIRNTAHECWGKRYLSKSNIKMGGNNSVSQKACYYPHQHRLPSSFWAMGSKGDRKELKLQSNE
jgi:hypothetical protein